MVDFRDFLDDEGLNCGDVELFCLVFCKLFDCLCLLIFCLYDICFLDLVLFGVRILWLDIFDWEYVLKLFLLFDDVVWFNLFMVWFIDVEFWMDLVGDVVCCCGGVGLVFLLGVLFGFVLYVVLWFCVGLGCFEVVWRLGGMLFDVFIGYGVFKLGDGDCFWVDGVGDIFFMGDMLWLFVDFIGDIFCSVLVLVLVVFFVGEGLFWVEIFLWVWFFVGFEFDCWRVGVEDGFVDEFGVLGFLVGVVGFVFNGVMGCVFMLFCCVGVDGWLFGDVLIEVGVEDFVGVVGWLLLLFLFMVWFWDFVIVFVLFCLFWGVLDLWLGFGLFLFFFVLFILLCLLVFICNLLLN